MGSIGAARVTERFFFQPKLTIGLLDQDDLRALAHLMNSYPSVLKEKALILQGGGK